MSTSMLITSAFVDALADYLQGAGVDEPEIMAPLLPYAGSAHMPAPLLMGQLEQLQCRHPVTALGFRIGRCVRPQHFGVVGYLTQYCNSLGEALAHYYRFQKLVLSALSLQVHMEDGILVYRWHNGEDQPSLLTDEFSVAASVSLYQALIGQRIPPAFIELPHPRPADAGLHEALIGCPIRFDSPCLGFALPTNLLAMRVATSDPFLLKLLDEQAAVLLASAAPDAAGDPFLMASPELAQASVAWVGYLSTTGVYGDHQGGWVDEATPLTPVSARGAQRVLAESQS